MKPTRAVLQELRDSFNALPVSAHLGTRCVTLEPGRATVTMTSAAELRNANGAIAGPYVAGLADVAAGLAVVGLVGTQNHVTIELALHFLRPALSDPLTAVGAVVWRGGRHAFAQVEIRDADDQVCAHATGTWALHVRAGAGA